MTLKFVKPRFARLLNNPMAEGGPVCIFGFPKFLLKFVSGTTPGVEKTWVDMLDHGSNSEKRFKKWPPEAIPKNLFCFQIFFFQYKH